MYFKKRSFGKFVLFFCRMVSTSQKKEPMMIGRREERALLRFLIDADEPQFVLVWYGREGTGNLKSA